MRFATLALLQLLHLLASPVAAAERGELAHDQLMKGATPAHPFAMTAFAPGPDAGPPSHTISGVLTFEATMDGFRMVRDSLGLDREPDLRLRTLPRLELALAQDGGALIPLKRGPIPSGHPSWEFAVEPGQVWTEPSDEGLTRAALPFALIETLANCTHNGVLTFLFGADGAVSNVAWQIASETCAYLQFDAWGLTRAVYRPQATGVDAAIAAFRAERDSRMPTKPMVELKADFPSVDPAAFASPADIVPSSLTTFGVVAGGVHYTGGCETRAGPYPFCEALLAPSYSLAKSLVGGLGLMRLELLQPGVVRRRISDHVPECGAWKDVTLEQTLDMATGRYQSPGDQVDENLMASEDFYISPSHREKIALACNAYPRREAAGRRWVYHTTDTYILGAAMQDIWRDMHGVRADFFNDVLVGGIYEPLHLSPTISATRRTLDDARQPFTGWGLTLLRDDIAKLGVYLTGRATDPPTVALPMLDAALQRNSGDSGLPAGSNELRYNNGFWAYNAQRVLNCERPVWIPFLSGYGGVVVILMPNGVVYYYVSDGGNFVWARAVKAADAIAPLCGPT